MRLFADDCLCYHEIKEIEDTVKKLQKEIDRLGSWARDIRFQPVKCIMMQLTKKLTHKVESIKYLGETITNDLK